MTEEEEEEEEEEEVNVDACEPELLRGSATSTAGCPSLERKVEEGAAVSGRTWEGRIA